jgi:hypothetical protein
MNIKSYFKFFAVLVALTLTPFVSQAQFSVTLGSQHVTNSNWNADSLVRNVLLGEGVEIFNVQFNEANSINYNGVGTFNIGPNSNNNVGIQSGIVLSTSEATYLQNTTNGNANNCPAVSAAGKARLDSIINHNGADHYDVNDVSMLEFDFIPRSDSIKFRYVFMSAEYHPACFVCKQFNDAFGFFLTGLRHPDDGGGMFNNTNIARLPNSTTEISINSVNGGCSDHGPNTPCLLNNTAYYVDNYGANFPVVKGMNGMTTVLTAEAKVIPCQTYHIKMAIANASDHAYHSAVFLEANSLNSNPIDFRFVNNANPSDPSRLFEGCEAKIVMTRPHALSVPTAIDIDLTESTATLGDDYEGVNPLIYFPANVTTHTINVAPKRDAITEGEETVKLVFSARNGCQRSDSVQFSILDVEQLVAKIVHDSLTNSSISVLLNSDVTGGMEAKRYFWEKFDANRNLLNTYTTTSVTTPTMPDSFWKLTVNDSCGNTWQDSMVVGIRRDFGAILRDQFGSAPLVKLRISDTTICEGAALDLVLHGADSCVWAISGQQPFELQDSNVHLVPTDNVTKYIVHSYLWWNDQYWEDVDSVIVTRIPLPNVQVAASKERICQGESITLTASGSNMYTFDGDTTNFETANTHVYAPDTTTMYVVWGLTNGAKCYGVDSVLIVVDTTPDIKFNDVHGLCNGESAELIVTTTAPNFAWSANPPDASLAGQEQHADIFVTPAVTTVYTVNASNGVCLNTKSTTIAVEANPIAIGEVSPKTVSLGKMEAVFIDQSQHSTTRKWEFPDGTERDDQQFTFVVPEDVDSISVRLWAYNPYMCFDTTTVTVYVDHTTLWAPNAFTPDESTNNSFLVKMNDVQRYHIIIYDRRGQIVFESYDPEQPWTGLTKNGKKCPQGVYTYIISCHKITYPYDQIVNKGTVVLIR